MGGGGGWERETGKQNESVHQKRVKKERNDAKVEKYWGGTLKRRGKRQEGWREQSCHPLLFLIEPSCNDTACSDAQGTGTCCSVMIQPLSASAFTQQDAVATVTAAPAAAAAAAATVLTDFPFASPA